MTTIAWRAGLIAADSMVCGSGNNVGSVEKLIILNDGAVLGSSGQLGFDGEFVRWYNGGADVNARPKLPDDIEFMALVASASEVITYSKWFLAMPVSAPFHAIGSGADLALGAMAFGASARQAVEVACQFDVYSGGEIVEIQCRQTHSHPGQKPLSSPRHRETSTGGTDPRPQSPPLVSVERRPDGDRYLVAQR